MSEPNSYMRQLDRWTEETVFGPLYDAFQKDSDKALADATDSVKKAIREKVLESYRNGQQAPRKQK